MWLRLFVAVALSFCLASEASDPSRNTCAGLIYVTDNPGDLQRTINIRKHLYGPQLKEEWRLAKAEFKLTDEGEEVLVIKGLEVMRGFEKPYMSSIARTAASLGGAILNVGYGIGFIDSEIERLRETFPITEHHIIELNRDVSERAKMWRDRQPGRERIFVHEGGWKEVLQSLVTQSFIFDAIAYDAFPLEKQELHRDFVPFLEHVIKLKAIRENTGLITFYMDSVDGFGSRFTTFAKSLGVGEMSMEKVSVQLPLNGNQYWERNYFFTPTLTQIRYTN
jgi:hypothetical protein